MSIRTFAVFPDKKFKFGGMVYIGSPDMGYKQVRSFVESDSFANYAKNERLRKCFDYANIITAADNADGKEICMAAYRFYPPFLWSKKKIIRAIEDSFDECRIG